MRKQFTIYALVGVLLLAGVGMWSALVSDRGWGLGQGVRTQSPTPDSQPLSPREALGSPGPGAAATDNSGSASPFASSTTQSSPTHAAEPTNDSGLLTLAAGWTRIEPGGETACARGTPYSFWVRPGTVNRLLVFFQGGGGCWSAETCKPGSAFFEDTVSTSDDPTGLSGVFDLANPANPFKDYYMVFVPYCTGDVHMGDNVQTYTDAANGEVTIHHKGFVNGSAAMDWIYAHFSRPESIFVTGCSAGSVGSIMFAPYIMERYRQSEVYQLGDSLAFVFDHALDMQEDYRAHDNFPPWIPALRDIPVGEFTSARMYAAIAQHYPDQTFSQYNTAHDSVQQRYYFAAAATPSPGPWEDALESSLREILSSAGNFRSYTAEGSSHCITPLDRFYIQETAGVRFRDWVDDMANGREVGDVRCVGC